MHARYGTRIVTVAILASGVALIGCDKEPGLFIVTMEPAGANCALGGQRIDTGVDDNESGVLDADEIMNTAYICDGADGTLGMDGMDGLSALVDVGVEPAGENCVNGGVRVDAGLDDDRDGTLDAEEIDATEYVCDGADAIAVLVDVNPEASGDNCVAGGQRIDLGRDDGAGGETAGDGVLGAGEIEDTHYVCNGAGGIPTLLAVTPVQPGEICPMGGQRLDTGLDNGDGGETAMDTVLGAGEIDATQYICDGLTGLPTLFTMTPEPPGTFCAAGGQRIDVGLDNGDGGETARDDVLGAGEIDTTEYVCNGTSGVSALVRITDEPETPMCPYGGRRLDVGLDDGAGGGIAGNGIMEDGEVTGTAVICGLPIPV